MACRLQLSCYVAEIRRLNRVEGKCSLRIKAAAHVERRCCYVNRNIATDHGMRSMSESARHFRLSGRPPLLRRALATTRRTGRVQRSTLTELAPITALVPFTHLAPQTQHVDAGDLGAQEVERVRHLSTKAVV